MTKNGEMGPFMAELLREVQELKALTQRLITMNNLISARYHQMEKIDRVNERVGGLAGDETDIEIYKLTIRAFQNATNRYVKDLKQIMGIDMTMEKELSMLVNLDKKYRELYEVLQERYGNEGETSE
jgi:DNA repair ATPase RecN